jgi:cyclopropane fatty-acyl-phospholipid synthase-like methyltransferase
VTLSSISQESDAAVSIAGTHNYYRDVTRQYRRYSGAAGGWHYGVWEDDVQTHQQALLRSNELLVRGLDIGPDTRILDAGCGAGGFATWAAVKFGCRVTGITLVSEHAELATDLARARGVHHLCEFQVAEMDDLPFQAGAFDLVVNQDSYCHAVDKRHYLEGVLRVLREGGAWRAVDFAIQPGPLQDAQRQDYLRVLEGFQIPSMISPSAVRELLRELGFVDVDCADITQHVLRSARHIKRMCMLPALAIRIGLDWTFFGSDAEARRNRQGHISAAAAYSTGLRAGYFRHGYYSAAKPDSSHIHG